jgi:hypothetical protein
MALTVEDADEPGGDRVVVFDHEDRGAHMRDRSGPGIGAREV